MSGTPLTERRPPSAAVVEAVAASEGVDTADLTIPLYDAIDPESLDRLVDSVAATAAASPVVTFSYHGYTVAVDADGTVTLTE